MTIQSISELSFRALYPEPSDETPHQLAEFIETAKLEYAQRLWAQNKEEWLQYGINSIPSYLLSEGELIVKDKEADISHLFALKSLSNNVWIQQLGGFDCVGCKYVIMDLNQWKILCDDDSRTPDQKAAIPIGKKIKFPDGTFDDSNKVPIIYANNGTGLDDDMEIEDSIGSLVMRSLIDIYGGKRMPEDKTNDSNSNS